MPTPHEDWPRFRRRRWWREPYPDDQASAEERTGDSWQEHFARFRPSWWPENEPWPPARRQWPRGARRPFLRRLGCLFLLLNLFVAAFFVAIIITVLNGLGVTSIALHEAPWVLPIGGILLAALLSAVAIAGASLRRMTMPLDDLLTAANRVAEGDYSARVTARGPAEVRSLATAFNSMASQLEAHDRQRRAMLADVTHELRTPLTIIQGNLEGVLDGMYVADQARLRSILDETQILARLTDDLRTLSLAESGSLELRREPVDLVGLMRVTIAAFQSQADSGGVRIDFSAPMKEKVLTVDAERIRQVLTNLIANAIRYSPRGSAVRAELSGDAVGATVSVTDSGPGIATADLPHVFDRYYKSADSRGMGLGLSIAKYIVEAHGGQIHAESRPEQGTTIWFTLPA
jgi:two-component system sensor histidine kinase BaeS